MGTRADFYLGRGTEAEWLGSIAWDGNPESICAQVLNCTSDEAYRHAVLDFFKGREDATRPSDGWPWPWDDSGTTDYAYSFDEGKVYASSFGSPWFDPTSVDEIDDCDDDADEKTKVEFPNMSAHKAVTLGPRSGVMVFIG